jgi:hypothetical protein
MWYNPIIATLLRSPLHGFISSNIMLLTCTGRKSGKAITVPVSYVHENDALLVISRRNRSWWRNLMGGAPVTLRLCGRNVAGVGKAIVDEADVIKAFGAFITHVPSNWVKEYGVTLDANGEIDQASLACAAQDKVMVEIKLT